MGRPLRSGSMMGRIIEVGSGEYWNVKSLEDCKKAHGAHIITAICALIKALQPLHTR